MSTPTGSIPVQKFKAWSIRANRLEVCEAVSDCGRWSFIREESSSAPWIVTHTDFAGWFGYFPSLASARKNAERQLHLDLTVNLDSAMSHS